MRTSINNPKNSLNFSSRDSLLKANAVLIDNLQKRINVKRFRPQEGDSVKLGYMRVLTSALQLQNIILKDAELDELKTELEKLKELLKCQSPS